MRAALTDAPSRLALTGVLALDASGAGGLAALVVDGTVIAERRLDMARGVPAALPALAQAVLAEAGVVPAELGLIAAVVGPGSFTGIRAALAFAHGLALASGAALAGVTVGEALAGLAAPGRALWVASDSRRGRVFLERGEAAEAVALDALPVPPGSVDVAGALAVVVASRLAARGADVRLLAPRQADAAGIARAGLLRHRGALPPRPAQPLYVDPPEARVGADRRPAPA